MMKNEPNLTEIQVKDDSKTMHKLRQLIFSTLKRNEFTRDLPLHISLRGYDVVVSGHVPSDEVIAEVVVTIESVSPNLRVHSRMRVAGKGTSELQAGA